MRQNACLLYFIVFFFNLMYMTAFNIWDEAYIGPMLVVS